MIKLAKLNGEPEIFHSVQGEGKNIGKPSVFIRLSLCNLYCFWCDTDYTWNWTSTSYAHQNDSLPGYRKFEKDKFISRIEDEKVIEKISRFNCYNLVITGGEPMAQKKSLIPIIQKLKAKEPRYHVEFETNGTISPGSELDQITDQYNVSVKLSNSRVSHNERIIPEAIRFFAGSPKSNFKFVIDSENDLNEVLEIIDDFQISHDKVLLMPQGNKVSIMKDKELWLVEVCKKYQFNFTTRLHIYLWGDKKGV